MDVSVITVYTTHSGSPTLKATLLTLSKPSEPSGKETGVPALEADAGTG